MKTTGLILAGGKSSRFDSEDKSWIEWQNKPMIQHVIERLWPQVDDLLISANKKIEQYESLNFPVIPDQSDEYRGPLEGILAAMDYLNRKYPGRTEMRLLITPCDMPLIPDNLIEMLDPSGHSQKICVAKDTQRIQPLLSIIPLSYRNSLQNFLSKGERKAETWILSTNPNIIDLSDHEEYLTNINNRSDLEKMNNQSADKD